MRQKDSHIRYVIYRPSHGQDPGYSNSFLMMRFLQVSGAEAEADHYPFATASTLEEVRHCISSIDLFTRIDRTESDPDDIVESWEW